MDKFENREIMQEGLQSSWLLTRSLPLWELYIKSRRHYISIKKTKDKTTSRLGGSKFLPCSFLKGFILTGYSLKQRSYKSKIMPEMTKTHAGKMRLVGLKTCVSSRPQYSFIACTSYILITLY